MPWLMKAEPDSRIVKGKDVKFSVDDFEELGTSQWDGVRNHEAKKIMKERMKLGDQVLFYHSNCKVPGVYGLAKVVKEGYPDYTAFDESHPYHDPKSSKDAPTWFMVDVKLLSRVQHPPTLSLIKYLASQTTLPEEVAYIGDTGFKAIREMGLVNRGRLSVQPVVQAAYDAVVSLGERGGWDGLVTKPAGKKAKKESIKAEDEPVEPVEEKKERKKKPASKRKAEDVKVEEQDSKGDVNVRRSKRNKA